MCQDRSLITNSPPPTQLPFVAPPPLQYKQSTENVMYKYLTASKELRQCAQSGLLDAYQRFVIRELKSRLPSSGYTIWITQSTLQCAEEHMAHLIECSPSTLSTSLPGSCLEMSNTNTTATSWTVTTPLQTTSARRTQLHPSSCKSEYITKVEGMMPVQSKKHYSNKETGQLLEGMYLVHTYRYQTLTQP